MKILLALAHYFRAEDNSIHASTSANAREGRAGVVRGVIEAWQGHLGETSSLNVFQRRYDPVDAAADTIDIVALIRGSDHLLDAEYCRSRRVRPVQVATDDPRFLPFAAHRLFADSRGKYDMYVYSEDDLKPHDASLLTKIAGFVETFGPKRLVMPNRYEWNARGRTLKTFIDGPLRPGLLSKYHEANPDVDELRQKTPGREILYRRAENPHSGFFAITAEQLETWVQSPHFLDYDCSFIRALESAATLGMLKTFPIYKSAGRDAGWLEIEHLDSRYSSLNLPGLKGG